MKIQNESPYMSFQPPTENRERRERQRRHWDICPEVETNPMKVGGARVFTNTRLPLSTMYEHLAGGASIEDIVDWFPGVEEDQIRAVLNHDARTLKEDDEVPLRGAQSGCEAGEAGRPHSPCSGSGQSQGKPK